MTVKLSAGTFLFLEVVLAGIGMTGTEEQPLAHITLNFKDAKIDGGEG